MQPPSATLAAPIVFVVPGFTESAFHLAVAAKSLDALNSSLLRFSVGPHIPDLPQPLWPGALQKY
jgi:hypothetical protein